MTNLKTTDLSDNHPEAVRVAASIGLKDFGGRRSFHGKIHTVRCFEDNSFVRRALEQNGRGKVLVVDGSGSLRCALLGDTMAELAIRNEWNGILIFGCVRDSAALAQLALGIKALGTHPARSAKRNQGEENVALQFAGVDFVSGEFIYCDEDGVLISTQEFAT